MGIKPKQASPGKPPAGCHPVLLVLLSLLPFLAEAGDTPAPPAADQRAAMLAEIGALTKADERQVPEIPARQATPERLEALYRSPEVAQLPKEVREYGLVFAARGGTTLFDFDKPSEVLARISAWFPNEIARAHASGKAIDLREVYFPGPHGNWTPQATAFLALWNCMPGIAWLKPADNPFMKRWNDGGLTLLPQAARSSSLQEFDFAHCVRENNGHLFARTMEQFREDQEARHHLAERVAPLLRAKFSRFLATNRCRGTGPDDCVLVLRQWASLAPGDADLARMIQDLAADAGLDAPLPELRNPGARWDASRLEDGQECFDAGLRRAAFMRARLLSVLNAPDAWPADALVTTLRQLSELRRTFAVFYVHRWYQYELDYRNDPVNPWQILAGLQGGRTQVRTAILEELARLEPDDDTDCEVMRQWFGGDKSLRPEYALRRLTSAKPSKCGTPDWDWLKKDESSKAAELRADYLRLLDRRDFGHLRELALSQLTTNGDLCFAATAAPAEQWLRSLCSIWVSEPPAVALTLPHSGLALDKAARFRATRLISPPQAADEETRRQRKEWLGRLAQEWSGIPRDKMRAIAADLGGRGIGVFSAKWWAHPRHEKSLLEVHLNDNDGTRLLFAVDSRDLVPVEVPDRFRGRNEIVEVSDLDGDGDLEVWWAESYRDCTGEAGDLQREFDCTAKTALMGEVQGGTLSYFTRSAPTERAAATSLPLPSLADRAGAEEGIRSDDDRPCNRLLIGSVLANRLQLDFGAEGGRWARGDIIDLVCKPHPENPRHLVVALFHDLRERPQQRENDDYAPESKGFVLAVIDLSRKRILSLHRESIELDASLRIDEFSLRLDTARYHLKPGLRALGVRMNIGHSPHCAEGGESDYLSLFVEEGKRLRPVLVRYPMSFWTLVEGSACGNDDAGYATEEEKLTLSLATTTSDGWRDLEIVSRRTLDKWQPASDSTQRSHQQAQVRGKLRMKEKFYR